MKINRFWQIIEQSRQAIDLDDPWNNVEDQQARELAALLAKLSPDEIVSFNNHLQDRMIEAYDYKLWAVADMIWDGCHWDNWLLCFESWLISMGREVYERALADPDSLAEVVRRPDVENVFFEAFPCVIGEVYEQQTGEKLPPPLRRYPDSPTGGIRRSRSSELEYFRREFPRLWAIYGERMTESAREAAAGEEPRPVGPLPDRDSLMNIDRFWQLIEKSRQAIDPKNADGNMERQIGEIARLLADLPPDEIVTFNEHLQDRMIESYSWQLWAAADLIGQGCSDDGFHDFRSWLVSMGREVYERALADPDSLAEVVERPDIEDVFFEEFPGEIDELYEQQTDLEMPRLPREYPESPTGTEWDQDDMEYFQIELPKLWAIYGAEMTGSE